MDQGLSAGTWHVLVYHSSHFRPFFCCSFSRFSGVMSSTECSVADASFLCKWIFLSRRSFFRDTIWYLLVSSPSIYHLLLLFLLLLLSSLWFQDVIITFALVLLLRSGGYHSPRQIFYGVVAGLLAHTSVTYLFEV